MINKPNWMFKIISKAIICYFMIIAIYLKYTPYINKIYLFYLIMMYILF